MRAKSLPNVLLVVVAASLVAAPLAGAATAEESSGSCSVPCGYIYPLIIIEPKESQDARTLPSDGSPVEVEATLTWTFDITNEGFTLSNPTEPIEVTFEFPRKPSWAGMSVEPTKFEVPVTPQYIEPAGDTSNPRAEYVYTRDITITMSQKDQATLRPGEDLADLLVFAKSSESGLYKPSYGIKEFQADPEDAVVREAGADDVDAAEVPSFAVEDATRGLGPVDVALQGAESANVFEPTQVQAQVTGPDGDGGVPSEVSLSLVDEAGDLLYATGPRHTQNGAVSTNLTFPEPGAYRVLVTASPGDGADVSWTPGTVAYPVDVPRPEGDAVELSNQYTARYHEVVSEVHAEPGDPARQYEKHIPVPIYDGVNGANLLFELTTDNPAATAPSGPANLNVELLSPSDGVVAKDAFDPANPTLRMPVNALPGEGLYQIHVFGQGAAAEDLAGAAYDVEVSTSYDGAPVLSETGDGVLDPPGRTDHGGIAVETQHEHYEPWTPQDVTIPVTAEGGDDSVDAEAHLTVLTNDGHRVVSTGWQDVSDGTLEASVTFPEPGRHLAAVHVRTPMGNGTQVQPTTLATPLHVGGHQEAEVTLPDTYRAEHQVSVPAGSGPDDPHHDSVPVTVLPGAASLEATISADGGPADAYRLSVLGPDGSALDEDETSGGEATVAAEDPEPGRYQVVVEAGSPAGGAYDLSVTAPYEEAVSVENPLFAEAAGAGDDPGASDGGNIVPAAPAAGLVALLAAGLALRGRRGRR